MVVAVLEVDIHMPFNSSLKEKRHILRSIKDRVLSRFDVSIAEVDYQDLWQRSRLAIAVVSNDASFANRYVMDILRFLEDDRRFEILSHKVRYC